MATVSVGQVLNDAFRRPIPVIKHRRRMLNVGKRRMRPGCVIQSPLIYSQLLMSQRQSHRRALPHPRLPHLRLDPRPDLRLDLRLPHPRPDLRPDPRRS